MNITAHTQLFMRSAIYLLLRRSSSSGVGAGSLPEHGCAMGPTVRLPPGDGVIFSPLAVRKPKQIRPTAHRHVLLAVAVSDFI